MDEPSSNASNGSSIRDLLARVERFRASGAPGTQIGSFNFETDVRGTIRWVEGAPRGPLIGLGIASASNEGAAAAFRRRMPFRDEPLLAPGDGPASGEWRISAVPFYDPVAGNFLGYRGSARRPRADEAQPEPGEAASESLFGAELPPDSLRQLIHELRTPLNAILGFAEMIDRQFLGPAPDGYRERAGRIGEQARHLLSAVEDLDTAARIETDVFVSAGGSVDLPALVKRVCERSGAGATVVIESTGPLPALDVEEQAAERIVERLLGAVLGFSADGERIDVRSRAEEKDVVQLSLSRPVSLRGVEEETLFDPGFTPEGDWPQAPPLGIGFALRLVRNLAEAAGGGLIVAEDVLVLNLPAAA